MNQQKNKKATQQNFYRRKISNQSDYRLQNNSAHKFIIRLGFKQCDVISTKEQSMTTKAMSSFEEENMQTQYNVSGYRIDLYFHDYNLPIEIDDNGLIDRNIDYKIKKQKAIQQELSCIFIRINTEKKYFDIFRTIKFAPIKQSTKKTLINKISARLLQLELKSDNRIKSKAMKFIVKKILSDYN